ncbi:isochorismate synthase [soil metagenome]
MIYAEGVLGVAQIQDVERRFVHLLDSAKGRRRLVSLTVEVATPDPVAAVIGSRMASDRWFCWEQPERDRFALAAVGSAYESLGRGTGRFGQVAESCALIMRDRIFDEPSGMPPGAGAVWVGGFSFSDSGGGSSHWSSFPPALMVMPELSLARVGSRTLMTVNTIAGERPDEEAASRLAARVSALSSEPLPMTDPHPSSSATIASVEAPDHYEDAVSSAVAQIRSSAMSKVVLAREVEVTAPSAHDPAAIFRIIREQFPSCFCFCCGSPEGAFLGASPELLVRRSGAGLATAPLAGSTRRSADPAVDDHLGEQLLRSAKNRHEHEVVVKRIERALRRHAVWIEHAPEPEVIKVANIQHLATPIHAQLSDSHSAIELAGLLHPTPAVGGEPLEQALRAIGDLEPFDRGWYAGPVGWMDALDDGEFCVALRSALLRDRSARLFAGAGIVADSDPAAELAETELKLDALLPLIAG